MTLNWFTKENTEVGIIRVFVTLLKVGWNPDRDHQLSFVIEGSHYLGEEST